jgi:glycosyltransferase involved in cell wall biosynthesis
MFYKPFVSVIVPVFHNYRYLWKCFSALDNQSYPDSLYEVIIVDDNREGERIDTMLTNFSHFHYFISDCRGSYAARNIGISSAQGQVLAFTDSDCIPAPDWIDKGVEALEKVPNCGLVGGKIIFFFKNPSKPTVAELFDSITFLQQEHCIRDANFGVTANLFTFKKVFQHVGLFNPGLISGGDLEWGNRVANYGYNLYYAESVMVKHPTRSSLRQMYKKVIRVNRGLHLLNNSEIGFINQFFEIFKNDLIPPIRRLKKSIKDDRIHGYSQKIKIIFGILFFKYALLIDKILLVIKNPKHKLKPS